MRWGRLLLVLLLPGALLGCRRRVVEGIEDVPPGLPIRPGVYTDINPRWSHDGKRIAFFRATEDRRLQLYVVDPELERPLALLEPELVAPDRPYSSTGMRYNSPDTLTWSPDDRRIAFERIEWFTFDDGERLPGTGLWSLDTQTGRVVPLALHPTRYFSLFYYFHYPQWSPNSRYVAFVGEGINGEKSIFIRPMRGRSAKDIPPRYDNYEDSDWPLWQPARDGAKRVALAFRQGILHPLAAPVTETVRVIHPGGGGQTPSGEIWRMRSKQYRSLLPNADPQQPVAPRVGHFVASPDGARIAFTLTPDANDYGRYEIWTMAWNGSDARRESPRNGRGYLTPVWISGNRLGALSPRGGDFDVVVLNRDSATVRTLGKIPTADCDWSPDRRAIVYAAPVDNARSDADTPTTLRLFDTHRERWD